MTYLRTGLSLTATLALSVSLAPPVLAQGGPGATGTLSFSQGLQLDDNFDMDSNTSGVTIEPITRLGFSARSTTRSETLNFQIGTEIIGEFGGGAADEFEVENSSASVGYERQGANSRLSFSASFTEVDLDESILTLGPAFGIGVGSGTLVIDDGSAEVLTFDTQLQTGIQGPFGLTLRGSYLDEKFFNTLDPDLRDRTRVAVDALAEFRVNPARTIRVLAGTSREDEDGVPDDTINTFAGLGIGGSTRGGLVYSADLIYDRSETSVVEDGLGAAVSVTQARPNGSIGADVTSRIIDGLRRTEASVNRGFTTPASSFGFALGVVDQEGDDSLRPLASLSYQRGTRDQTLSASLSQSPSLDSGIAYGNTSITVGYTQAINANSGWTAAFNYTAVNEFNGTDDDDRTTARLTYTRTLTQEWQMNTGVQHTRESTGGGSTETSNMVFFNIQRDITFGF